jgi:hypothetical protein
VFDTLPSPNLHLPACPHLSEKPIHQGGLANPGLAQEKYNLALASLGPRE